MSRPILKCFSSEALLCPLIVWKENGRVTWFWSTVESKILLEGHAGPAAWFLDRTATCTSAHGFTHPVEAITHRRPGPTSRRRAYTTSEATL